MGKGDGGGGGSQTCRINTEMNIIVLLLNSMLSTFAVKTELTGYEVLQYCRK